MSRTIYDIVRKDLIGYAIQYDDVNEVSNYLSEYFGSECNLKDETIFIKPRLDSNGIWCTFEIFIVFSTGTKLLIAELESSNEKNDGWYINELS